MSRDDIEPNVAEDAELRSLFHMLPAPTVPSFAAVVTGSQRRPPAFSGFAVVAVALALVVAGLAMARSRPVPAAPEGASAVPSSAASECARPSGTSLERHTSGVFLSASIEAIEATDPQTNQLWWTLRFVVPKEAPAPAVVSVRARLGVAERPSGPVLGYELREPERRPLQDAELLTIQPCSAATLVVRLAGPLAEGTFPYVLTIEKVQRPEGGTVSEEFALRLACSNRTFSCATVTAATTPAPTATTASDASVLDPRFGVIFSGVRTGSASGSAAQVRREGETRPIGELAPSFFNQFNGSVSPDGRRAAYFADGPSGPSGSTLYLVDGTKPTERQLLLSLGDEIPAARPLWSGDGTGIVFSVLDKGANQGVRPQYSALRTFDLATRAVTEIARLSGGASYSAVGWDRATSTLAALEARYAEPALTYTVFGLTGRRSFAVEGAYSMVASPDAKEVAGVRCEATLGCSLWRWPLATFDARREQKVGDRQTLGLIGFRPGTSELALLVGDAAARIDRIELWSSRGGRTVQNVVDGRPPDSAFFRADGRALIVAGRPDEVVVIDVASGVSARLPQPTPQAPFEIGRAAASIRLD
ncbi:MAG: hypothetical protein HY071_06435 [Chloroflexi bacterium]|nr:hypothetical protein [Chloroflexota bacterium]